MDSGIKKIIAVNKKSACLGHQRPGHAFLILHIGGDTHFHINRAPYIPRCYIRLDMKSL